MATPDGSTGDRPGGQRRTAAPGGRRRPKGAAGSPEVSVRSMHDPKPGWTQAQALDMARQGYSAEHVERVTGYAAAWVRAQLRRDG